MRDIIRTAKREAEKLKKRMENADPGLHACTEHFCGSTKPHYSIGKLPIGVCEDCAYDFMIPTKQLSEVAGGSFVLAVYSQIAMIHKIEGRLQNISDWTPETFEKMRDLCCRTSGERDQFNALFIPKYMEA